MSRLIDMSGQVCGRLTVESLSGMNKHGEALWRCQCKCGSTVDVVGYRLRNKHTTSCGCWKRSRIGDLSRLHGKSKTPEYQMFYDAGKRARQRGVPITIAPDDIVIPERCPVLGMPLRSGHGLRSPNTPTLDCIDPRLGYVPGNIIVVSWRFNKAKGDLTPEELRRIAKWVLR